MIPKLQDQSVTAIETVEAKVETKVDHRPVGTGTTNELPVEKVEVSEKGAQPAEGGETLPVHPDWIPTDESLIACWDLATGQRKETTLVATKGPNAIIHDAVNFIEGNMGLRFEGKGFLQIGTTPQAVGLTDRAITVEAWVLVDKPIEWGAFFSSIQDNGAFERGVLLGFRQRKFCFAVCGATVQQLTYHTVSNDLQLGVWHHVVGTYDGEKMIVYVDGEPAGESRAQSGKILYPESCPIVIGAYKDDNEFFPLTGAVGIVALYERALAGAEVKKRFAVTKSKYTDVNHLKVSEYAAKHPFRAFSKHVDLPAADDTTPTKIDDLFINKTFLMGLELFHDPTLSKGKLSFDIRRSDQDKQRWVIRKRKQSEKATVDIANFWRDESSFNFQWLSDAGQDEDVNYLRNGALKLSTPDGQSGWLNLRSPITIEGLKLTNDETSVKIKRDLPWTMASKSIVIELLPFPQEVIPAHCTPGLVTKTPAVMYFTRDESKAVVWLQVSGAPRTDECVLEAELKINIQGRVRPLTLSLLAKHQKALTEISNNALAAVAATGDEEAKKKMSAIAEAASASAKTCADYRPIISKLYGKDIPVAIYFNAGDHRVLIAKSPGVEKF